MESSFYFLPKQLSVKIAYTIHSLSNLNQNTKNQNNGFATCQLSFMQQVFCSAQVKSVNYHKRDLITRASYIIIKTIAPAKSAFLLGKHGGRVRRSSRSFRININIQQTDSYRS